MEEDVGTTLQCNNKLRSKLYSDDTEKLRRKLAYLQREYSKTQQKLKRAERSEGVKKHEKTRVTEQNSLRPTQFDPDTSTTRPNVDPSLPSPRLCAPTSQITVPPQEHQHTEGQVEADGGRESPAVRFLFPLEAAPPLTPASSQDDQSREQRPTPAPSSALRLRSRSSRLRRQQRRGGTSEVVGSTDTNSEEGSGRMVAETQEMKELRLSRSESESSALLLTHWTTERRTAEGRAEKMGPVPWEKETDLTGDELDGESPSLLVPHRTPALPAGRGTPEDTLNHTGTEAGEEGRGGGLEREVNAGEPQRCGRETKSDGYEEGNASGKSSHTAVGPRGDRRQGRREKEEGECDRKVSLAASCTLWDGLVFPPEYYVRTTRRMTSSQQQQQPDMESSLLSNLIVTSRARGRGRSLHALQDGEDAEKSNPRRVYSDTPPQMVSSASSHEAQCSGKEESDPLLDNPNHECRLSAAPSARPVRGRKKKRGGRRGRRSEHSVPALISSSPSQSSPLDGVLEQHPVSVVPLIVSQPSASPAALPTGIQPPAQDDGQMSASVSGSLQRVYPVFKRSSSVTERPPEDVSSWQLPSPPAPSDPLHQPSPLALGRALKPPVTLDYHLPDEEFGSLKLLKLRQVMDAAAEPFSAPSYHTRCSSREAYALYRDQALALSLPFSPTPDLSMSLPGPDDGLNSRVQPQCPPAVTQIRPIGGRERVDTLMFLESTPVTPGEDRRLDPCDRLPEGGGQSANGPEQNSRREAGSPVGRSTGGCLDRSTEQGTFSGTESEGFAGHLPPLKSSTVLTEQQGHGGGVVRLSEDHRATNHQRAAVKDCDFPAEEPIESPSKCITSQKAMHACTDPGVQEDQRRTHLTNHSLTDEHTTNSPTDVSAGSPPPRPGACSQLLLSPSLVSPPCPFLAPHLLPSSPPLPSLGLTPHQARASRLPLTSSPCAPSLTLPSPISPSTLARSPPDLSPCPALVSHHRGAPAPAPTPRQTSVSLDPPMAVGGQSQEAGPGRSPSVPDAGRPVDSQPPRAAGASSTSDSAQEATGETKVVAEKCAISFIHTLTAPAGGSLVDACCVSGPSGGLCVVAAGTWAVCLWDQSSSSGWGLVHTWTFNKRVISVFSVPDSVGLLCVTLGQLEIQEVRVLSCSSLVEALLCQGVVQVVVGVARSRVVCSSHSPAISTLQIFMLSEDTSAPNPQPLAPPGMHVGALATVDGLKECLLGSAEGGHLFLWNLDTGQLLQRIQLDKGLTHTACLQGYSYSGVLLVLLQHQYLGSIVEKKTNPETTLFTLVAINALSGKSVVANRLHQPEAWSGRLCEADVLGSKLVALSESGCVYVWELGGPMGPRVVWAPEADGWHVARWDGSDILVTGHQNGDLTVYRYDDGQNSVKTTV